MERSRLLGQSVHPIGQVALLVGIVERERERGCQVGTTGFGESERLCLDGREAWDNGGGSLARRSPVSEISRPVVRRFVGRDSNGLVQRSRGIVRHAWHIVRILCARGIIFDNQLPVGVLIFHMHRNLVIRLVARHRLNGRSESIHFRFVGRDDEFLLRLDYLGQAANGMELNIIEGEIVTYVQRVSVEVDDRDGYVIAILFGIESLGVLVPDIIAELSAAEV